MTESEPVRLACRRFPAWAKTIETLYRTDAIFEEICLDYYDTVNALAYWTDQSAGITPDDDATQATPDQAVRIAAEYWVTLQALEEEIDQYLSRHRPPAGT